MSQMKKNNKVEKGKVVVTNTKGDYAKAVYQEMMDYDEVEIRTPCIRRNGGLPATLGYIKRSDKIEIAEIKLEEIEKEFEDDGKKVVKTLLDIVVVIKRTNKK